MIEATVSLQELHVVVIKLNVQHIFGTNHTASSYKQHDFVDKWLSFIIIYRQMQVTLKEPHS